MTIKKQYIFAVENPHTQQPTTFLVSAVVDAELITKFIVESFDGEHRTPSRFEKAVEEDLQKKDSKSVYNIMAFYPAGFADFIEKLQKLREAE